MDFVSPKLQSVNKCDYSPSTFTDKENKKTKNIDFSCHLTLF